MSIKGIIMKKICSILILFFFLTLSFGQSILEPEVLNKLQASVYEVIVNKAAEGNIEYEIPDEVSSFNLLSLDSVNNILLLLLEGC